MTPNEERVLRALAESNVGLDCHQAAHRAGIKVAVTYQVLAKLQRNELVDKGYRNVGPVRVALYFTCTKAGVAALAELTGAAT